MKAVSVLLVAVMLMTLFVQPALAGPPPPPSPEWYAFVQLYHQVEGQVAQSNVNGGISFAEREIFYFLLDFARKQATAAKNSYQITRMIKFLGQVQQALKEMSKGAVDVGSSKFTILMTFSYMIDCQMFAVGKGHYMVCPGRKYIYCVGFDCREIRS